MFHDDSSSAQLIELSADIFLASSPSQSAWQFAAVEPGLAPFLGGIDTQAQNSIFLITAGFANVGTFTRDTQHSVDLLFNRTTQK